ncbi:uncharacterized protein [Bemisia tabaci]|nr:PREDICTED: zinc finger protein 425-like [Bemisia tabaci]
MDKYPGGWIPGVQLKNEFVSEDSLKDKDEYRADLGQDALIHNGSELNQHQPITHLENEDVKLFARSWCNIDDPLVQKPLVLLERLDAKLMDSLTSPSPAERKHVTLSLLKKIKVEEAEDDINPLREHSSKIAVLQLVPKREIDIEFPTTAMIKEQPDSKPEVKLHHELIFDSTGEYLDNGHQEISTQSSNSLKDPIVVLGKLDPQLVSSHLKAIENSPSPSHSVPPLELRIEETLDLDHLSIHDQNIENQRTSDMSMNDPKSSLAERRKSSNGRVIRNFAPTKNERLPRHFHLDESAPESSSSFFKNSALTRHQPNEDLWTKMSKSGIQVEPVDCTDETLTHIDYSKNSVQPHAENVICSLVECAAKFESKTSLGLPDHTNDQSFLCGPSSSTIKSKVHLHRQRMHVQNFDRTFKRDACSRSFLPMEGLKTDNRRIPRVQQQSSCAQCSTIYKSKGSLERQFWNIHFDVQKLQCSQCSKKFKKSQSLRAHMTNIVRKSQPFPCGQCLSKFKLKSTLKNHMLQVHSEHCPFSCAQCTSKFKLKDDLKQHILQVHSEHRSFSCAQCSSKFKWKSTLKRHMLQVHSEHRPFSCAQCSSKFKLKSDLRRHILQVHIEYRPFSCAQCSGKFKWKGTLKRHMLQVHSEHRPFSCAQCSSKFKLKGALKRHMFQVHSEHCPFSCDQCSSKFKWKGTLKRHMLQVHSEHRPLTCAQCSSKFKSKGTLKRHMLQVHSEHRPFSCAQCSSKFKLKGHLKRHMLHVHSEYCPFSCDQCSSKFKLKDDLKRHMLQVHSEHRPLTCAQCSRKYKLKDDLKRHILQVHIEYRPFSCAQCSSKFKLKRYLKQHLLQVHGEHRTFSCAK